MCSGSCTLDKLVYFSCLYVSRCRVGGAVCKRRRAKEGREEGGCRKREETLFVLRCQKDIRQFCPSITRLIPFFSSSVASLCPYRSFSYGREFFFCSSRSVLCFPSSRSHVCPSVYVVSSLDQSVESSRCGRRRSPLIRTNPPPPPCMHRLPEMLTTQIGACSFVASSGLFVILMACRHLRVCFSHAYTAHACTPMYAHPLSVYRWIPRHQVNTAT